MALILGLAGRYGGFDLPESLQVLAHPVVIGISGLLAMAEFVGDKIPWLDSVSDAIHIFSRIPAGAALAAARPSACRNLSVIYNQPHGTISRHHHPLRPPWQ